MKVMPYAQRQTWLLEEIERERFVDVINSDFVIRYADATGASYRPSIVGAGWCPLLSSDLMRMYKYGLLKRHSTGLSSGAWQPGLPKWVYSYRLSVYGRDAATEAK